MLLKDLRKSLPEAVVNALEARLDLRLKFLGGMIASQDTNNVNSIKTAWSDANSALQRLRGCLQVATTQVEEAFDARIQQKLASTMPPRPIVNLSMDDALGHLGRLFADNLQATDVVEYSGPEPLLVLSLHHLSELYAATNALFRPSCRLSSLRGPSHSSTPDVSSRVSCSATWWY